MEVEPHAPQEAFRLLKSPELLAREDVVVDQRCSIVNRIEIFVYPIERMEVAESSFALLYVWFNEIPARALADVTLIPFGELG